jgi:hypothetical protein
MKPQIYKVGMNWILWVPGVRVYRFANWNDALSFALDPTSRQTATVTEAARSATSSS